MASLSVWEYVRDQVVHVPMGDLMIDNGVVSVLDFGLGDYRPPSKGEAAEIARTFRLWAEQIEKSVVESATQEYED